MNSLYSYWNLNEILSSNSREVSLNLDQIQLRNTLTSDYLFTPDIIHEKSMELKQIGITQRLLVEQDGDHYTLLAPLLSYLAMRELHLNQIDCIVRTGDPAQMQQILSIHMNAHTSHLSPLVYSRLITRLSTLYPVIKSLSRMILGNKRDWIAGILGISSSAVFRYSYISKMPAPLQLRANYDEFPYLCFKDAQSFTDQQFHELLSALIHYELRSPYRCISATDFSHIIRQIAENGHTGAHEIDHDDSGTLDESLFDFQQYDHEMLNDQAPVTDEKTSTMPLLYEHMVEQYYIHIVSSFADQLKESQKNDELSASLHGSPQMEFVIPDQTLRDIACQLYDLAHKRFTCGQRTLDHALLRSMMESIHQIYDKLK